MSPAKLSTAKSSFTVPTTTLSGSSSTWKSELSGIVPPEVSAVSRAPRRPRSTPLTSSRCSKAPRRPRRVLKPSASMRNTSAKVSRARSRNGHARRISENKAASLQSRALTSADDLLGEHIERLARGS